MIFRHGHNCADGPLVCVIPGDDAAPEVVRPTVELLHELVPGIRFREALSGREAQEKYGDPFPKETRQAISAADCTFFWRKRWTKQASALAFALGYADCGECTSGEMAARL